MSRSPSPIRAPEVQVSEIDSLQWIFASTQALLEQIYFSLNLLVDIAQIRIFEDNYRALDNHVDYLIPFIGLQFNNYNIPEMISSIRALQINLEDEIHTFYQNLSEWEQLKVVFTLPQFQNHLF